MSPISSDHDPTRNRYGMKRDQDHQTPNQQLRSMVGGSQKTGRRYNLTRGGTIHVDGIFRLEGITGSFGLLQVQSTTTWEVVLLSKPGGVCKPFELEMQGPLVVEAAGLSNAIAYATLIERF